MDFIGIAMSIALARRTGIQDLLLTRLEHSFHDSYFKSEFPTKIRHLFFWGSSPDQLVQNPGVNMKKFYCLPQIEPRMHPIEFIVKEHSICYGLMCWAHWNSFASWRFIWMKLENSLEKTNNISTIPSRYQCFCEEYVRYGALLAIYVCGIFFGGVIGGNCILPTPQHWNQQLFHISLSLICSIVLQNDNSLRAWGLRAFQCHWRRRNWKTAGSFSEWRERKREQQRNWIAAGATSIVTIYHCWTVGMCLLK